MTTNAIALMEEAKWEMEGVRRATERYREAAEATDPSALPSGQWLLRQVLPPFINKITALKLETADLLTSKGRPPPWAWPIQLLDTTTMAVIATICCLDASRDQAGAASSTTTVALSIAGSIRDEVEYQDWLVEQSGLNKTTEDRIMSLASVGRLSPPPVAPTMGHACHGGDFRVSPWDRPRESP